MTKSSYTKVTNTELTQRVDFSCCYLYYDGIKYQLDANNYKFEATVVKTDINSERYLDYSRILSFESLRDIMKSVVPDKTFLYSGNYKEQVVANALYDTAGIPIEMYEGSVSAEVIVNKISLKLKEALRQYPGVSLKGTKLRETVNSYVSWNPEKEN